MTDNELLLQILETVKKTDSRVDRLETGLAEVKAEVAEVKSDLAEVKAEVAEVKSDLAEVKAEVAEVKSDLAEVKTDLRETRVLVENTLPGQINLIAEGHGIIIKQLRKLDDYPMTKERVATLEGQVSMVADRVKVLETA